MALTFGVVFLSGIIFSSFVSMDILFTLCLCLCLSVAILFLTGKRGRLLLTASICTLLFILGTFITVTNNYTYNFYNDNFSSACIFTGKIDDIKHEKNNICAVVKLTKIKNDNITSPCHKKVYLYLEKSFMNSIDYGDVVVVNGEIKSPLKSMNFGGFNYENYYRSLGVMGICSMPKDVKIYKSGFYPLSVLRHIRDYTKAQTEKYISGENADFANGVLFGDKSDFSEELTLSINNAGISHVTAVSGMHVSIFTSFMLFILGFITRKRRTIAKIIIVILIVYAFISGLSPSVVRAVIMSCITLTGLILGRKTNSLFILCLTGNIMLFCNPYLIYNPSFVLSFLATAGIILFSPYGENGENSSKLKEMCKMTLFANIVTFPYLLWNFGSFSWIGLIANLIITPLISIVFVSSLITALVGFILPAGVISGVFSRGIIGIILSVVKTVSMLPFGQFEGAVQNVYFVFAYSLAVALVFYCLRRKKQNKKSDNMIILCYTVIVSLICGGIFVQIQEKSQFSVTYLYVGQGDSAVINIPGGKTILVDTGDLTSKSYCYEYLKLKGINKIDTILISHSDADHCGGLEEIVSNITTENVCITKNSVRYPDTKNIIEVAKANACNLTYISAGDRLKIGDLVFEFLHPNENFPYMENFPYEENDSSMVFTLNYKGRKFLFTGDISSEFENTLNIPKCDVLKVSHHGSDTATSYKFLQKVNPQYAVISCGIDNKYSHPHTSVIYELERIHAKTYITAISGAVRFTVNKSGNLTVKKAI
ncbi:MAG: DNA internalization-related competence protein ComEC/Rec2 [Clostridia bacterium]|nr:DNA internalization-related competence protein ComEC/Rec2 [Clostridia bacterium]